MSWDLALLKKFSCTSHFRLLNQVRSELKAQPLVRDRLKNTLTVEVKPFTSSNERTSIRPNILNTNNLQTQFDTDNSDTFNERLNSIELG